MLVQLNNISGHQSAKVMAICSIEFSSGFTISLPGVRAVWSLVSKSKAARSGAALIHANDRVNER